jgi:hypothetical protein
MRKLAILGGLLALCGASVHGAEAIRGDYLEARTADVFTGPCFSNAEVFITGHQAVMAWSIRQGSWNGEDLSGLCVAAAVRGTTTFSEDKPELAKAVLIVDQKATPEQKAALIDLAKHLGGDRLQNVVDVKQAAMTLKTEPRTIATHGHAIHHGMPQAPRASFRADGLAEIATRPLNDQDHFCGNETVAYEPLSKGVKVLPAYTLGNRYDGSGLDTTWSDPNCRSSFVGRFSY